MTLPGMSWAIGNQQYYLMVKPMKTNLIMLLVLLGVTAGSGVYSQDTIVKRNGEKIACTVKEIGSVEIKYVQEEFRPGLLFTVERKDVVKIVFTDGRIWENDTADALKENIEQNSLDLYQMQKKNAWKVDFTGLVSNVFSLTYERCLSPGNSVEFSLGYVGLGVAEQESDPSGILFRGGYKLMKSPDYFLKDMRYAHILKGQYVKFELDIANYGFHKTDYDQVPGKRETLSKWAVMTVFGKQWVFSDKTLIDVYSGIGFGRRNRSDVDFVWPYGFGVLGKSFPLATSFGVRVGFLTR